MQLVPFEAAHLRAVEPQAAQLGAANVTDAVELARDGMAFTGLRDGRIVGCAGVVPLWEGVGQAWAVLSDEALDEPIALTRAVERALVRIAADHGLRRIQATVADGHDAGARWLAFLGFEVEGLLVNYGPGGRGDHWIYGKVTTRADRN